MLIHLIYGYFEVSEIAFCYEVLFHIVYSSSPEDFWILDEPSLKNYLSDGYLSNIINCILNYLDTLD